MTATVPGDIAWPLIIFTAIVIVVRCKWFSQSQYEAYFNNTLSLMFLAQLLRESAAERLLSQSALLSVTAAQQLSLGIMILAATEFMGFVSLWSTHSPTETSRRQRHNRIVAAVVFIAFLVAATRARVDGKLLELSGGWDGVLAWGLYAVMLVALSVHLFRMCVKEIRRPDVKRHERLVAAAGMLLAFAIGSITLQAVALELLEELHIVYSANYRLSLHGYIFFWITVAATALAVIPCGMNLIAHYGLDRVSRDYGKLSTFRQHMINAVPEVDFELARQSKGRRKTLLELHQTTVQIRDAILQLRRYLPDIDPVEMTEFFNRHAVPVDQRGEAALALQLAYAAGAKRAGTLATATLDSAVIFSSRPRTLEEETAELLKISRWWQYALVAVNLSSGTSPIRNVKIGPPT
ncbi:DUF6545 domain-containing protein [Mycobacterium sp. 1245852.3]|uniref:DUF6545 domain-containing protein n=1 Tax=Mycobacterium sp. 1245852.3 TaxID=1856860 RepID=UPI0009ED81C0|nr:DUF6545 domain-containing protein [Mycobacterium sp. 1245852.3]